MKRIWLVAFAMSNVLFSQTFAQTFTDAQKTTISETKKLMDDNEQESLDEANNRFEEANFIFDNADQQDLELDKYFEDGSTPKGEKKAVNVKIERIEGNRQYANAYNMIYDALLSRYNKLDYAFPEDKETAESYISESNTKLTEASAVMDNYRFLDDDDLKTYLYEDLKDKINESHKTFEAAIGLQCQAIDLYFAQEEKKASMSDEDIAWSTATSENTYDSYSKYLAEFPEGKYADEARQNLFVIDPDKYNAEMNPTANANSEQTDAIAETEEPAAISGTVSNSILAGVASNEPQAAVEEEPVYSEPIVETTPKPVVEEPVYSQPIVESTPAQVSESSPAGIIYRIQIIAVTRGELTESTLKSIYSGSETVHKRFEDGMYKYSIGEFTSFREALNFKNTLGIESFVVKFKDGQRVN